MAFSHSFSVLYLPRPTVRCSSSLPPLFSPFSECSAWISSCARPTKGRFFSPELSARTVFEKRTTAAEPLPFSAEVRHCGVCSSTAFTCWHSRVSSSAK